MLVRFLCGCEHDVDKEDLGWWRAVSTDRLGFVVCVAHRQRRECWNSFPTEPGTNLGDWSYAKFSPLEIEKHVLFGEPLVDAPLEVLPSEVPDRRDNRDPEEVGREILARANGG